MNNFLMRSSVMSVFLSLISIQTVFGDDFETCYKSGDGNHPALTSCLQGLEEVSSTELKQSEDKLRSSLKSWYDGGEHKAEAMVILEKQIASFSNYRKDVCDFQWQLSAGGNGAEDSRLICITKLNRERTKIILENVNYVINY